MNIRKQKKHETWSKKTLIIILEGKNQENKEGLEDVYLVLSK